MFYHKQIEAADKKLRATTQFLEEQAVEREIERDEAQKEISALREQLREGEKNRNTADRINREVCTNWHGLQTFIVGTI